MENECASQNNKNYIQITEKPIIHFNRQIEFIKDSINQADISKYFIKTILTIKYTIHYRAKDLFIKLSHFLSHTSVIYKYNDSDFSILQNVYHETISPNCIVAILKSIIKVKGMNSYAEFN